MASATDRKADFVAAVEKALNGNRSLQRVLEEETWSVEVHRVSNLEFSVRVDWDKHLPKAYYTIKVSEPW